MKIKNKTKLSIYRRIFHFGARYYKFGRTQATGKNSSRKCQKYPKYNNDRNHRFIGYKNVFMARINHFSRLEADPEKNIFLQYFFHISDHILAKNSLACHGYLEDIFGNSLLYHHKVSSEPIFSLKNLSQSFSLNTPKFWNPVKLLSENRKVCCFSFILHFDSKELIMAHS